ncbi:WD repeat and SOCS box-containing protein 1-like [Mizuhopecten yessoensis]|uniref:WD repeat and SOCS box-containing protein 1-like n=1 Tax=Mizuhopecten yessoensis TaxID=6573 RepID=UPI000B45F0F5|nr:WD repeat and SOCS box-containing protein 1-like [Mizuhopecten yessoensis]
MRNIDAPSSFSDIDAEDIDHIQPCDELSPLVTPRGLPYGRSGQETWSCAWAPDNSFFAWSCGSRTVQLVPWDKNTGHLTSEAKEYNSCAERRQRLVNQISEEHLTTLRLIEDLVKQDRNEGSNKQQVKGRRVPRSIDCGGHISAVAFGTGTSKHDYQSVWKRFKFDDVLILATGLLSGKIKTWDCNTGNLLMELSDHRDSIKEINFAPDRSLLFVSASRDGTLKVWDLNDDGNMTKTLRGKASVANSCKWSPNCKMIASVGNNKSVALFDMSHENKFTQLKGHYNDVCSCDFSPDGALLATASYDTRVILWDPYTGDAIAELGHMFPEPRPIFAGGANDHYLRDVSFCNNGLQLVTVCDDGYMRVWDLQDTSNPMNVANHSNALCCSVSPNGHTIAVGDRDGGVAFYRTPNKVASLQHQTRRTIRTLVPSNIIDHLHLPLRIKEYLKYHAI